jgi:hypothetical protein
MLAVISTGALDISAGFDVGGGQHRTNEIRFASSP